MEHIFPLAFAPPGTSNYKNIDFDNFRFMIYEFYLYAIVILIDSKRYDEVIYLLENEYYISEELGRSKAMLPYHNLQTGMDYFEIMNRERNPQFYSPIGHFVKDRCKDIDLDFACLMQADLCLGVRSFVIDGAWRWFPWTLVFSGTGYGPFELFARASSAIHFGKIKSLLAVQSKDQLKEVIQKMVRNRAVPQWGFDGPDIPALLGLEEISTKQ